MASSRVRTEQVRPAGDYVPGGETIQPITSPFGSGGIIPVPVVPEPSGVKSGSIPFVAGVGSVTQSESGAPITDFDLSTVNAAFVQMAYLYPGGASDKNNAQWLIPSPSDMNAVPNIRIRLHFLGRATPP